MLRLFAYGVLHQFDSTHEVCFRLNNAPEWSGGASTAYQLTIAGTWTASLRADVAWQSRVFFTPANEAIEVAEVRFCSRSSMSTKSHSR
jgi:hypothetical protein